MVSGKLHVLSSCITCFLSGVHLVLAFQDRFTFTKFKYSNTQSMTGCKEQLTQSITVLDIDLNRIDNDSFGVDANYSNKISAEECDSISKCGYSSPGKVATRINIFQNRVKDGNLTDKVDKECDNGLSQMMLKVNNAIEESRKESDLAYSAMQEASISLVISDTNSDDHKGMLSGPSRGVSGKTVIDGNITENLNEKHDILHPAKMEDSRIYSEILDKDSVGCEMDILSGASRGLETMNQLTNSCTKSEDIRTKLNSKIRVYQHRGKTNFSSQNNAHPQKDGSNLKVDMVDSSTTYLTQCRDEKLSGDNGDVTNTCNQTGIIAMANKLSQSEAKIKCNVEEQSLSESDELGNALALLYRERQELYSQICDMEDTLAINEDQIARIRDGGEVDLARKCIKSIISGNYHSLLEYGTQVEDKGKKSRKRQHGKHTPLLEYLPGKSSCQDLELTCVRNNWRLPRYLTDSSDGKFVSSVVVVGKDVDGKDINLHTKGGLDSKPNLARESAAAQMFAVIRNSCYQAYY